MRREIILAPNARLEFEDAVAWSNEREMGLGDSFEVEVHATFQRIAEDPERFQLVGRTLRKAQVRVFNKDTIYFRVEPNFISVVSVFHGARNPAGLRRRLR